MKSKESIFDKNELSKILPSYLIEEINNNEEKIYKSVDAKNIIENNINFQKVRYFLVIIFLN